MACCSCSRALHVVAACVVGFIHFGVRAAGHVGCRWARKRGIQEAWKSSSEEESGTEAPKDMPQVKDNSMGQTKRRRTTRAQQTPSRMLTPRKRKPRTSRSANVQSAEGGANSESRRCCPTCGGPSFEVRRSPTRFSSLEALVGGHPGAGQAEHGPYCEESVRQGKTGHGLHGRREVRVGSGSQMTAKQIRVAKRVDLEVGRLLGRSKVTCDGTKVWASKPCPEKMLRTSRPLGAPEAEGKGLGAHGVASSKDLDTAGAGQRPKGSFRAALEIAKDKALMADAVESLKRDFWSESNREAQASKRKLVVELAQAVGGEWWSPPLTEDVVLGVAAAVKAAGLKTAGPH